MSNFKGIKALEKQDLKTLFENGSVTLADGRVITYSDDTMYVTEEEPVLGLPIGSLLYSAVHLDNPALCNLDGRCLSTTGMYKEFSDWLHNKLSENWNSVPVTTSIDEYANDMRGYGQCGKFVVNDTAERIACLRNRINDCIRYEGYRLNSKGGTTAQEGYTALFIPVQAGERLYIDWGASLPEYSYIYETSDHGLTYTQTSLYNAGGASSLEHSVGANCAYVAINIVNGSNVVINARDGQFVVEPYSIKLPTITEFVASSNGGDTIGTAEYDRFKNHQHYLYGNPYNSTEYLHSKILNASFTRDMSSGDFSDSQIGGATSGGGDETRPMNVRYPLYIVVATGVNDDVQIDLNNVANDVNGIKTQANSTESVLNTFRTDTNSSLAQLANNINALREVLYPVGAVYMSMSDVSPASIYGGVWEQCAKGRTLMGYDPNDTKFNWMRTLDGNGNTVFNHGGDSWHSHNLSYNGYAKIALMWNMARENELAMYLVQPGHYEVNTGIDAPWWPDPTDPTAYRDTNYQATSLGGFTDYAQTFPPYTVVNIWVRTA